MNAVERFVGAAEISLPFDGVTGDADREMVKHDGDISFRRALSLSEWQERLNEAGVEGVVKDVGLGRLCVERLKKV